MPGKALARASFGVVRKPCRASYWNVFLDCNCKQARRNVLNGVGNLPR